MRIGFATCDWATARRNDRNEPAPGGACNVRMQLPCDALAANGYETHIGGLVSRKLEHRETGDIAREIGVVRHDNAQVHECDVLVMQRMMNDDLPDHMRSHRAAGFGPIVNDVDDWFWGISTKNQAWKASHKSYNPKVNTDHYKTVLGLSDAITVSTPFLLERMRRMFPLVPIYLVPNAIDMALYTPKRGDDGKGHKPTFGWVGAIPWRSGDLESAGSVVASLCNQHGLTFHHSGSIDLDDEQRAKRLEIEAQIDVLTPENRARFESEVAKVLTAGEVLGIEWRTSTPMCAPWDYAATMFEQIDVGIVPLSDIPFNEAKSAIKGMEYAAAGVPFVAQNTPAYVELYERYGIGRIAHRSKHWLRELTKMLDPGWRAEQREQNLEQLKSLDITQMWPNWAQTYAKVRAQHEQREYR